MAQQFPHVVFVFHPRWNNLGSTSMRSNQIASLMIDAWGERFSYSFSKIPKFTLSKKIWALAQPRGAILFFTKMALKRTDPGDLQILRRRGIMTCLDYVDSDLNQAARLSPDVHLAASFAAETELASIFREAGRMDEISKIRLLHHNADRRLKHLHLIQRDHARTVYLGTRENFFESEKIRRHVDFLDASDTFAMEKALVKLVEYNLHYCVRPHIDKMSNDKRIAKPFTKGFTASELGVPVIVGDNERDAVRMLGEDYPFLVRGQTESNALQVLDHAWSAYGGEEWLEACERVSDLKRYYSSAAIRAQFQNILQELG